MTFSNNTQKLAELGILAARGGMSREEEERWYKALMRIGSIIPPQGNIDVITTENVEGYVKFQILRWSSGVFTNYPFSASGLRSAISASSSGDTVFLPAGTITLSSALTVPAGIEVVGYYNSIIAGSVTNNGILTNLQLTGTLTNNGTLKNVIDSNGYYRYQHDSGDITLRLTATHANNKDIELFRKDLDEGYRIRKDGNIFYLMFQYDVGTQHPFLTNNQTTGELTLKSYSNADMIFQTGSVAGDYLFNTGNVRLTYTGGNQYLSLENTDGGNGEAFKFMDSGSTRRNFFYLPGSDVVAWCNQASNGVVQIRANTSTAGSGGEVTVIEVQDDQVLIYKDIVLSDGENIVLDTTTGSQIGTATTQKLGFYGSTPITQPTEITDELTTITHTAPGTPDYAVQDLVDSGVGSAFGFATKDEGNTVLSVIANLQARVNELEDVLSSLGLVADAD